MGFPALALRMTAGGIAWALHFGAIYATTTLLCARGGGAAVPWAVAIATLAAVGACVFILFTAWRERDEFVSWQSGALAGVAIVAILWQALPALMVPACG